jgi:histidyl-tRNA synthetase
MARFQPPRSTRDLPPEEAALRKHVETEFGRVVETYGFQPIQTPTFESVELFSARSGPEIRSSLLTFHCDHEELALRPEMTAPVCRLISSGALDADAPPHKLCYVAPCFRYCRPGSGRYREFTQAGIECIGESGPAADAEVIAAACRFLEAIGIAKPTLRIGSIGIFGQLLREDLDADDRATVIGHLDRLMGIRERCRVLAESEDPLLFDELKIDRMDLASLQEQVDYSGSDRIEDRRISDAAELAEVMPGEAEATYRRWWDVQDLVPQATADLLIRVSRLQGPLADVDQEARSLLAGTRATDALDELLSVCRQVEMYGYGKLEVVLGIARGFTFYTSTVFEILSTGSQGVRKYCGGGRYDRLIGEFGGPELPAIGCAFRFDSLLDEARAAGAWSMPRPFQLFLLAESEEALGKAVGLAENLRGRGVRVGVAVGPQTEPTTADCEVRKTERIGLVSGSPGDEITMSDGNTAEVVPSDAEALVQSLMSS